MRRLTLAALLATAMHAGESYREGKLLEQAEYTGKDGKRAYVCVESHNPDRILIGRAKRVEGRLHPGQPVLLKYDDENLWVRTLHGKTVRLQQDYLTRAFMAGSPCEQVVEAAFARMEHPQKTLRTRLPAQFK